MIQCFRHVEAKLESRNNWEIINNFFETHKEIYKIGKIINKDKDNNIFLGHMCIKNSDASRHGDLLKNVCDVFIKSMG